MRSRFKRVSNGWKANREMGLFVRDFARLGKTADAPFDSLQRIVRQRAT